MSLNPKRSTVSRKLSATRNGKETEGETEEKEVDASSVNVNTDRETRLRVHECVRAFLQVCVYCT